MSLTRDDLMWLRSDEIEQFAVVGGTVYIYRLRNFPQFTISLHQDDDTGVIERRFAVGNKFFDDADAAFRALSASISSGGSDAAH